MILTLEVTGPLEGAPKTELRKTFQSTGGTIGRLPDNDWVLPDPYVSSRHARIRFQNGTFLIEDTSTNGVFINSPDNRLTRGQLYTLKSGDRIFIEPYEIKASITTGTIMSADTLGIDDPFGQLSPAPLPASAGEIVPSHEELHGGDVDPLSLLGFVEQKSPTSMPKAADLASKSVLSDHYKPPMVPVDLPVADVAPSPSLIPDDYDPLSSTGGHSPASKSSRPADPSPGVQSPRGSEPPVAASPRPQPSRSAPTPEPRAAKVDAAPPDIEGALAAVLAGAGLEGAVVTQDLARQFGDILRIVVSGVMDVLQARQRIKDEFRMRITTFKPRQNNPLKFSANVEDALHNLLVKRNPAYLGPVDAFEDAFDDIRNHQMAMLAGMRVAFDAMLAEFNPDRLQTEFDRLGKGSLVPGKLRYWDLYRDKFSDMVSDADTSFRELFGQEFAKAYEEQLERLKAQGRPRNL
jgi:type VI secretion system FHA domain protein